MVAALEKSIRDWVTTWNGDPKPFVWTKSADEIFRTPQLVFATNSWRRTLGYPRS